MRHEVTVLLAGGEDVTLHATDAMTLAGGIDSFSVTSLVAAGAELSQRADLSVSHAPKGEFPELMRTST